MELGAHVRGPPRGLSCEWPGHRVGNVWFVGVGRGELTDSAWARIEPLLPVATGRRGRWRDHRQVINGILWRLRTGGAVAGVPMVKNGPWKTAHKRLWLWIADGT